MCDNCLRCTEETFVVTKLHVCSFSCTSLLFICMHIPTSATVCTLLSSSLSCIHCSKVHTRNQSLQRCSSKQRAQHCHTPTSVIQTTVATAVPPHPTQLSHQSTVNMSSSIPRIPSTIFSTHGSYTDLSAYGKNASSSSLRSHPSLRILQRRKQK